jgi:hypothetical protein
MDPRAVRALPTQCQGMGPGALAITNDGRYAFVTFFLSDVVLKVRLADMTVEAKADLSQYFSLGSFYIVLDASERKIFVHSTLSRLIVIDTQTMSVIRTIENIPATGMIRSRHGAFLLTWDGTNRVRRVDTETYAVTEHICPFIGFLQIQESPSDPDKWYVQTVAGPPSPGWKLGLYDHAAQSWVYTITNPVPGRSGGSTALRVLPNEKKAYLAVIEGWYPDNHAYGFVYAVDLETRQAKDIPVDGGALSLESCCLSSRCYPSSPLSSYPAATQMVVAATWTKAPAQPAVAAPGHAAQPGSRGAGGGAERSELALDAGEAAWHAIDSITGEWAPSMSQRVQPCVAHSY